MTQVTEKGQVTIPVGFRRKFGLLPHTEVEFFEQDGQLALRPKPGGVTRGRWIAERLRGSATNKSMTTDEIMALTRGED